MDNKQKRQFEAELARLKIENDEKLVKHFYEHHSRKMNRRDFLSSGIVPFAATMTLPSIINIMANAGVAEAQEALGCGTGNGKGELPPLITINLAGGAAMSGNFAPKDSGNQPLISYSRLGHGGPSGQIIDYPFGTDSSGFFSTSGMSLGMQNFTTNNTNFDLLDTAPNTSFLALCLQSQNDTSTNPLNIEGMVNSAGKIGRILPNLGINRNQAAVVTPQTALAVRDVDSITNALGTSGKLSELNSNQKSKVFELITKLSSNQGRTLSSFSGGLTLGKLVEEATGKNLSLAVNPNQGVDPAENAGFSALWDNSNRDREFSTIVYNVLKGNGATGNLSMGGYDYHQNDRATITDVRDNQAGRVIGQVLKSAQIMGQKVCLLVTSDGAVGAPNGAVEGDNFTSDYRAGGAAYMFLYDPLKKPELISPQIGYFTENQAADDKNIAGQSVERGMASVFANYLAFGERLDLFSKVASSQLNAQEVLKVVKVKS